MPRAVDRRNIEADYDPTRSGTEFHIAKMLQGDLDLLRQALEAAAENMKQLVLDFIKELTGLDFASIDAFLASLGGSLLNGGQFVEQLVRDFFTAVQGLDNVPVLGDINEAIESTFESIEKFFDAFQGIDLNAGPGAVMSAIADAVAEALGDIPVVGDIANLVAQFLRPDRLSLIPLSSIGDVKPNLLWEGGFDTAETTPSTDGWTWDGTVGRGTPVGSAKITANGTVRELYSNRINVSEGQELTFKAWVRWRNLVNAQPYAPILLAASAHNAAGEAVSWPTFTGLAASPGANSSNSGQSDFVQMTGTWTVPAGIASVALRLSVRDHVTAGQIWFDDAEVFKTQKMPQSFVSGLLDSLAGLQAFTQDVIDAIITVIRGIPVVGAGLADFLEELTDWFDDTQATAAQASDAKLGLQDLISDLGTAPDNVLGNIGQGKVTGLLGDLGSIIDNAVKGAGNLVGSGFGVLDLFGVLRDLQTQMTDANQALALLQSDQGGDQNSGNKAFVKFADHTDQVGVPLFTKTEDTGAGGVNTVAGLLEWQDSGGADAMETYIYQGLALLTDYFETSMVMPRRPETTYGDAYNHLVGRSNVAGTRFCDAEIGPTTLRVGCIRDGARTWFGNAVSFSAPAGALITFRGGTTGGVRVFQILVNNSPRATFTDTGAVSYLGADYRYCGLRFRATPRFGGGQSTPGNVSAWAMNDNAPTTTVGVGFRAFRASTGGSNDLLSSSSFSRFGANTLDTIDRKTPDMLWDPATQKLTIGTEGWYALGIKARATNAIGEGSRRQLGFIHVSGGVTRNIVSWDAQEISYAGGGNGSVTTYDRNLGAGPPMEYLRVGDTLQPAGMGSRVSGFSTYGLQFAGDADGSDTYMSVVLLNRSLA